MLGPAGGTPYDLHFQLFGIPVRIHPGFFLVGALLGWSPGWAQAVGTSTLVLTLMWLLCLFVSILIHELGHALLALRFGYPPAITLYHFGGYASFRPGRGWSAGRSIAVSLAGPLAGFCLFALVWIVESLLDARHVQISRLARYAFIQLEYINLWWGVINLLPVLPLDGGQVAREICLKLRPRDGLRLALWVTVISGGATAALLLGVAGRTWGGVLFGMLAVQAFLALRGRALF